MRIKKHIHLIACKGNENNGMFRTIMLSLCLFAFFGVYAQTGTVTVNLKNATVKDLFDVIEKQTTYRFSYRDVEVQGKNNVSVNVKNEELKTLLTRELTKNELAYTVSGNKIVVTPLRQRKAESGTVSGRVLDANGEPIIGATIIEKGTSNGTVTDFNGNFTLNVAENATLEVSYIGYESQQCQAVAGVPLNLTLKEDTEMLDEVVVVGYGSQKKVNVIGSISTIDSKSLESRSVPDVSNLLTGQMSGVTITQSSGNPGQDAGTIRIRGVGSFGATPDPLVLVDGMPGSLSDLTPADIDNISVLKDASSAAIYGSRAANGVILVTTKKGREGKTNVIYNGSVGISQATELPDFAHSYEYAEYYNMAMGTETYTPEMIQKYRDGSDPDNYADEMYLEELLGGHAFQTKHELNVSGGNNRLQYMASMGYLRQNGLMDNNYYNRYSGRLNL